MKGKYNLIVWPSHTSFAGHLNISIYATLGDIFSNFQGFVKNQLLLNMSWQTENVNAINLSF